MSDLNLEGMVIKKTKEERNRGEWIEMVPRNLRGLIHILKVDNDNLRPG